MADQDAMSQTRPGTPFGRRGGAAAPQAEAPSLQSGGETPPERLGLGGHVPDAPAGSLAWCYFKACVAAFATAILISGLVLGSQAPGSFGSHVFTQLVSGIVMLTLAPLLILPIRVMEDVMRLLRVPRGASDVAIGGLCGALMMLPDLTAGLPPRPLSLAFVAGGLFGGFVFWRSRGYPSLDDGGRKLAELVHAAAQHLRKQL